MTKIRGVPVNRKRGDAVNSAHVIPITIFVTNTKILKYQITNRYILHPVIFSVLLRVFGFIWRIETFPPLQNTKKPISIGKRKNVYSKI